MRLSSVLQRGQLPTEETAIQDASIQARKITHAEISTLPRRFWPLANNSFLLHGCHNYHHLLLIKEKDHLWLGVPGLYDPREAHMANLFGFPQFTSSYISILGLTEDECENSESFGHWCRYLMWFLKRKEKDRERKRSQRMHFFSLSILILIQINWRFVILSKKYFLAFLISEECPFCHICPFMVCTVINLHIPNSFRMHTYPPWNCHARSRAACTRS